MTLQEAYLKAKDYAKRDGFTVLHACTDYGDAWGFMLWTHDDPSEYGGGYETIVNKETGEVRPYNPVVDGFDLIGKGKPVPLTLLKDRIPPAAKTAKRQKPVPIPA